MISAVFPSEGFVVPLEPGIGVGVACGIVPKPVLLVMSEVLRHTGTVSDVTSTNGSGVSNSVGVLEGVGVWIVSGVGVGDGSGVGTGITCGVGEVVGSGV